jgi:hypothetical protein
MATLQETVSSGRRWRYVDETFPSMIWRDREELRACSWTTYQALSNNFEIEPEPEKPREWFLTEDEQRVCLAHHHAVDCIRVHDADQCDRLRGKP